MFSALTKSTAAFLVAAALLTITILAGCQAPGGTGQAGLNPTMDNGEPEIVRVVTTEGVPVSSIFLPAQNIQDLVNRSHAVVIGTISAISEPKREIGYNITQEEFDKMTAGLPEELRPYVESIYYDIAIEEVLLDDGNVRAHPKLRLEPSPTDPRLNHRYLMALVQNPDSLSYGIGGDWMMLTIGDDGVHNLDGSEAGYAGVTNETTLLAAIRGAVDNYDFLPPNQWPTWRKANEEDSAATPAAPGGSGDGDAGPTGNTNN